MPPAFKPQIFPTEELQTLMVTLAIERETEYWKMTKSWEYWDTLARHNAPQDVIDSAETRYLKIKRRHLILVNKIHKVQKEKSRRDIMELRSEEFLKSQS